jgi:hypothetical protein
MPRFAVFGDADNKLRAAIGDAHMFDAVPCYVMGCYAMGLLWFRNAIRESAPIFKGECKWGVGRWFLYFHG